MSWIPYGHRFRHQPQERPRHQYHEHTRKLTKVANSNHQNKTESFQSLCSEYFLYNGELWTTTKTIEDRTDSLEQKLLCQVMGVRQLKTIKGKELYETIEAEKWSNLVKRRRLSLLGCLLRLDKKTPVKKAFAEYLQKVKQKCGRRKTFWVDKIKKDFQHLNINDEVKLLQPLNILSGDRNISKTLNQHTILNTSVLQKKKNCNK